MVKGKLRHFVKNMAFIAAILLPQITMAGCAGEEAACSVGDGTPAGEYHLILPNGTAPQSGWPAVIFLHGWGSSGAVMLQKTAMVTDLTKRGFAVITPEGTPREGDTGRQWLFHPNRRNGRDEAAFLRSVADDAAKRFGLDRETMILAGFSIGGSMVSYLACETPDSFAAYAPVAGNLWRPHPQSCTGPVDLFHTHGWSDGTVPLEGRSVGAGMTQGDVFQALAIWREANACSQHNPNDFDRRDDFLIRNWTNCDSGKSLSMALHPRGHIVPDGWANMMLDWFEALPGIGN